MPILGSGAYRFGEGMDLAEDERIKRLNDQIQQEKDPEKVLQLSHELVRLIDAEHGPKPRAKEDY